MTQNEKVILFCSKKIERQEKQLVTRMNKRLCEIKIVYIFKQWLKMKITRDCNSELLYFFIFRASGFLRTYLSLL